MRILPVVVGVVIAGLITFAALRTRRARKRDRERQVPELNRHPERLEQMLDRTDDA